MRPILSIFLALIISVLFSSCIFYLAYLGILGNFTVILITIFVLCGGIATWFSTENKARYGVYYGLLFALIFGFFTHTIIGLLILSPIFAGIGGVIAKNEKNTIKSLLNNKFQVNYKSFFINLYKRNKIVLIVSLTIFFVSVLISGIGPYLSSSFNQFITNLMINYLSAVANIGIKTTLAIFLHNSNVAFFSLYIGGLFFGISSIMELVYIGFINGFIFVKYPFTMIYILPHGIFEVSSYIIAGAAGFKLLSTALNIIWGGIHIKRSMSIDEQFNRVLSRNYLRFRDSLVLIVIAIVLLFIAAIIEANISMAFGNYVTGLNIHSGFAKYLLNLINH